VKRWRCDICEHVYDPAEGDPAAGIAPGTPFESLPDTWVCPDCGSPKSDFHPMDDGS
jgi:rubredoxin